MPARPDKHKATKMLCGLAFFWVAVEEFHLNYHSMDLEVNNMVLWIMVS